MKESADNYLDDLSRKVIGKSTAEHPSFDFTKSVMSQIEALNSSKVTTYVPLISKRVWTLIAVGVIAIFGFSIFGNSSEKASWLGDFNLDYVSGFTLSKLTPSFNASQTLIYAVLLFGVMLCIQIPLLKHYFNKRIDG